MNKIIDYYEMYLKIRFYFKNKNNNFNKIRIPKLINKWNNEKNIVKEIIKKSKEQYTLSDFRLQCVASALFSNNFFITDITNNQNKYNELKSFLMGVDYHIKTLVNVYYKNRDNFEDLYKNNEISFYPFAFLVNYFELELQDKELEIKVKKFINLF